MKDFAGDELAVGDWILYCRNRGYFRMTLAKIIQIKEDDHILVNVYHENSKANIWKGFGICKVTDPSKVDQYKKAMRHIGATKL